MQQHNEHPTIEQLSALLDQQLAPQEQATCDAHLRTCQQCQHTLLNLRQTVALLHALPKPELPRSFVLPAPVTPMATHAVARHVRVTAAHPPSFSAAATPPATQTSPHAVGPIRSPHGTATDQGDGRVTPTPTAANAGIGNTPQPGGPEQQNQIQPLPPLLDLTMPLGREGLGVILFVLGIVGVILARRRRTQAL